MKQFEEKNVFNITGNVVSKRFNEDDQSLFLVIAAFSGKRGDESITEFPSFVIRGENAVNLNAEIKMKDRVFMSGHVETEPRMVHTEGSMFKRVYGTTFVPDTIVTKNVMGYNNTVEICGEIIRIFKNQNNNNFCIASIRVGKDIANVTIFPRMADFSLNVGDKCIVFGNIRTKNEESEGSRRKLTSVVARNVIVFPKVEESTTR